MKGTPACHGGDRLASFSVFLPVYVDTTPKMDKEGKLVQAGKFHVNVTDIEQFIEQHYMMQAPHMVLGVWEDTMGRNRLTFCQVEDSQADVQTPEPISQADGAEG